MLNLSERVQTLHNSHICWLYFSGDFLNILSCLFYSVYVTGNIYHGVYVIRISKAVPKAHEAQRQEIAASSVETLVHANFIGIEVIFYII